MLGLFLLLLDTPCPYGDVVEPMVVPFVVVLFREKGFVRLGREDAAVIVEFRLLLTLLLSPFNRDIMEGFRDAPVEVVPLGLVVVVVVVVVVTTVEWPSALSFERPNAIVVLCWRGFGWANMGFWCCLVLLVQVVGRPDTDGEQQREDLFAYPSLVGYGIRKMKW